MASAEVPSPKLYGSVEREHTATYSHASSGYNSVEPCSPDDVPLRRRGWLKDRRLHVLATLGLIAATVAVLASPRHDDSGRSSSILAQPTILSLFLGSTETRPATSETIPQGVDRRSELQTASTTSGFDISVMIANEYGVSYPKSFESYDFGSIGVTPHTVHTHTNTLTQTRKGKTAACAALYVYVLPDTHLKKPPPSQIIWSNLTEPQRSP